MKITSLQEYAMVNCNCCDLPEHPEPIKTCESLQGNATSYGYADPDDTTFKIYKKYVHKYEVTASEDIYGNVANVNAYEQETTELDLSFNAQIGSCITQSVSTTYTCDSEGSSITTELNEDDEPRNRETITREKVSGQQTEEYTDWLELYPTQQDYDDAVAAYDQYLIDYDQYNTDYNDWVIEWEAWNNGGQIGPEPTEPTPPDVVEEPIAEPNHTYPDCYWKDTFKIETGLDEDPVPDPTYNYSYSELGELSTTYGRMTVDAVWTTTETYTLDETYSQWKSNVLSWFNTNMNFDNPALSSCKGSECNSYLTITPEPSGYSANTLAVEIVKARYKFTVPPSLSARSVYELQWDEFFFPTTGTPYLIASREWVWNGNYSTPDSPWYEIAIQNTPGETRIVNLQAVSWKSTKIGTIPAVYGEIYEL